MLVLDQAKKEEAIRPIVKERFDEFQELLDFRVAIESAAARLAALRRTKKDLGTLTRACRTMELDLETGRFRAADSAFHLGIAEAARNRFMRQSIEDARAAMWLPIDSLIPGVFRTANEHHAQILDAIERRDPDDNR